MEDTAREIKRLLQQAAERGEDLPVPGLGTFLIEHEPSSMERTPDGRFVLSPPRDMLRFVARDQAGGQVPAAVPAKHAGSFARFSRKVREHLSTQGHITVPQIGTFAHEKGSITFEPEDALLEAINQRYAGLEPESLDPTGAGRTAPDADAPVEGASPSPDAPTEPPAEQAAEEPEVAPATPPDFWKQDEPASPKSEQEAEAHAPTSPADEPEEATEEPAPTPEETVAALFERAQHEERPSEEAAGENDIGGEETHAPSEAPDAPQVPASRAPEATAAISASSSGPASPPVIDDDPPRRERPKNTKQKRGGGMLPWVALMFLFLAGAGFLAWQFTQGTGGASPGDASELNNTFPPSPGINLADDTLAQEQPPAGSADTSAAESEEPTTETPTTEAPAAAASLDPAEGGFSIVVLSTPEQGGARDALERYASQIQDREIPVGLIEADVNGTTWYRIGVGQFTSLSEAQRTLSELSDQLPSDAWIVEL